MPGHEGGLDASLIHDEIIINNISILANYADYANTCHDYFHKDIIYGDRNNGDNDLYGC